MASRLFLSCWLLLLGAVSLPAIEISEIKNEGDYVQAESGTVFPAKIGDFQRTDLKMYGKNPLDVSASYRIPGTEFLATAYSFSIATYLKENPSYSEAELHKAFFEEAMRAVRIKTPDAKILTSAPLTMQAQGQERKGWAAVYAFPDEKTTTSQLLVFDSATWQVKFRFTYEEAVPGVEEKIKTIVQGIGWPKGQ